MQAQAARLIKNKILHDISKAEEATLKIWPGKVGKKGRGVVCIAPIAKGEMVEFAPVIPMPKSDITPDSVPDYYVLAWNVDREDEQYCLVGGYVMLYNHSNNPNVMLEEDRENMAYKVIALRDIEQGEEILWNYNCELWFDPQE